MERGAETRWSSRPSKRSTGRGAEVSGGALENLARAMGSWRTAAVALLSFASGLPLGLVWYAIPDWMRSIGVDIRIVGLFSLAQVPWAFKVLWSPLMDRYVPPFWGRRRGWMAIMQLALAVLSLALAGVGSHPDAIWVVGAIAIAIALASASQDVAYDAYAVDVLREDEQGPAVGSEARVLPRRNAGVRRRLHHARRALGLGRGQRASRARLPGHGVPDLARSRARSEGRGAEDPSRRRVGALSRFSRAAPRARDPRVRLPLQVRRSARPGTHAAVSHRHGLRLQSARGRAFDHRDGGHDL